MLIGLEIRMMNQKNFNSVGNALLIPTYVYFAVKAENQCGYCRLG